MILMKTGIFNFTKKNKKTFFTTLYKSKDGSLYIKLNNKIKNKLRKGGDNHCGLRHDGKTSRDLDIFVDSWMKKEHNLSWSDNQDGYYLNNNIYLGPYAANDIKCTDFNNHIHVFSAYSNTNIDKKGDKYYEICIKYSQKK